jgi:hypothetical protein
VSRVYREAQLRSHRFGEVSEQLYRSFDRHPTLLTDEVSMSFCGKLVRSRPMAQVGVQNNPEPLQLIESAVDRRYMDIGSAELNRLSEFFGCQMSRGLKQCFQQNAPRSGGAATVCT